MPKYSLKELKDLQDDNDLDLSANQLTEVPGSLHMVSRLTNVDLSCNKISFLPSALCGMTRLVKLDLGRNQIHHLPDDFGRLINLQYLNLFQNEIEELPLSFANLKSLKWLDLKKNPLNTTLAKAAGNCGNEKECQAAALNCVKYAVEQKKKLDVAMEKEKKLNEKIQAKNTEEKRKNYKEKMAGNAKSNAGAAAAKNAHHEHEHQHQHNKHHEKAGNKQQKKQAVNNKNAGGKCGGNCVSRGFASMFRMFTFLTILALSVASIGITLDCIGDKQTIAVAPLCKDVNTMMNFKAPSAKFVDNGYSAYSHVIGKFRRDSHSMLAPVGKKIGAYYSNFAKTDIGKVVDKYATIAHTFIVEKFLIAKNFTQKKYNELSAYYYKNHHATTKSVWAKVKIGLGMAVEVLRDVAIQVYNGLVHIYGRIVKFVHALSEGGFQAAMKTIR